MVQSSIPLILWVHHVAVPCLGKEVTSSCRMATSLCWMSCVCASVCNTGVAASSGNSAALAAAMASLSAQQFPMESWTDKWYRPNNYGRSSSCDLTQKHSRTICFSLTMVQCQSHTSNFHLTSVYWQCLSHTLQIQTLRSCVHAVPPEGTAQ